MCSRSVGSPDALSYGCKECAGKGFSKVRDRQGVLHRKRCPICRGTGVNPLAAKDLPGWGEGSKEAKEANNG